MCKVEMLRALLNQRLRAAVEEVIGVFARTLAEYEEELCRTKEENEHQRQLLAAVFKPQVVLHGEESSSKDYLPAEQQEWISKVGSQEPEHPRIKEEEDDIIQLPLTGVPLKVDDEAEEVDGEHCGQLQAESLLAPLSDTEDTTLHSPDTDEEEHSRGDVTGHTDKKHLKCSQCDKAFHYSSVLMQHMRSHTGEKPFVCSVCGKRFPYKGSLTVHTRTHTGEKPHSCSTCNKSFTDRTALIKHMRTHTGEKPFRCSVCGKRYTQNESLKTHSRTHTDEKPFSCLVCHKSFGSHSSYARHKKTHERKC
ncbi:uncharacterized protein LOC144032151 [Festucalex cinctus]